MPRSSSSRSSSRSSSSRGAPAGTRSFSSAPSRAAPPAPKQTPPPPAPMQQQAHAPAPVQSGGMLAGLGSTMAQGFAFGTGSAVAHSAVNSLFGGGSSHHTSAPAPAPAVVQQEDHESKIPMACRVDYRAFNDCLKANPNNGSSCEFYFNSFKACQEANM